VLCARHHHRRASLLLLPCRLPALLHACQVIFRLQVLLLLLKLLVLLVAACSWDCKLDCRTPMGGQERPYVRRQIWSQGRRSVADSPRHDLTERESEGQQPGGREGVEGRAGQEECLLGGGGVCQPQGLGWDLRSAWGDTSSGLWRGPILGEDDARQLVCKGLDQVSQRVSIGLGGVFDWLV
jgi:hypothetical protein